jgi:hypothetical protein
VCWTDLFLRTSLYVVCSRPTPILRSWCRQIYRPASCVHSAVRNMKTSSETECAPTWRTSQNRDSRNTEHRSYNGWNLNVMPSRVNTHKQLLQWNKYIKLSLTLRNWQKVGHVWINCNEAPRSLWCGGDQLHRKCPRKTNTESTPSYCNCILVLEKPHPASYRGCSQCRRVTVKEKKTTSSQRILWEDVLL